MKIGVYCEFFAGNTLGGREYIVGVLAELFARRGDDVELVHHESALTADHFTHRFNLTPGTLQLRYLEPKLSATGSNLRRRRALRKAWDRSISEPYDLFINIVHGVPVPCHARNGVLMVLFPFFRPFEVWAGRAIPGCGNSRVWVILRHLNYRLGWGARMRTYAIKTSISHYVERWTERRWHLKTSVLYPPSADAFTSGRKEHLILSVGRFTGRRPGMVDKRQLEMMNAFREMESDANLKWRYLSLGAVGTSASERDYFDQARSRTTASSEVVGNPSHDVIREAYGRARIFWHAAGYGNDENVTPELSEHFGIATVDAMMCGCVPVVVKRGAQPEIVENGISGFLWETLEELQAYTQQLCSDQALRERMSEAAQIRAKLFSRERFMSHFSRLLQAQLT